MDMINVIKIANIWQVIRYRFPISHNSILHNMFKLDNTSILKYSITIKDFITLPLPNRWASKYRKRISIPWHMPHDYNDLIIYINKLEALVTYYPRIAQEWQSSSNLRCDKNGYFLHKWKNAVMYRQLFWTTWGRLVGNLTNIKIFVTCAVVQCGNYTKIVLIFCYAPVEQQ